MDTASIDLASCSSSSVYSGGNLGYPCTLMQSGLLMDIHFLEIHTNGSLMRQCIWIPNKWMWSDPEITEIIKSYGDNPVSVLNTGNISHTML